ncbi:YdcF family protein [Longispora albida]|uniref:YdcF family protein n=1 Tax=Longispora albida TaxID=203523 RepID=UPI00036A4173|nr:YdcF family protein [Longispora albida]
MTTDAAITRALDAATPAEGPADFAIVFGNRQADPVVHAARLYHSGLVPAIVLTGGESRTLAGHNEARAHAAALREAGVPDTDLVIEDRSQNTVDNALFAAPLIAARLGAPTTATAILRWYHFRAVVHLFQAMPSLRRVHTVCYDHPDHVTGEPVSRAGWPRTARAAKLALEYRYLPWLEPQLTISDGGWVRK